jgi:hypothetical protein
MERIEKEIVFSLRLEKELYAKVKEAAKRDHRSVNQILVSTIEEWIKAPTEKVSTTYHRAGDGISGNELAGLLAARMDQLEKKFDAVFQKSQSARNNAVDYDDEDDLDEDVFYTPQPAPPSIRRPPERRSIEERTRPRPNPGPVEGRFSEVGDVRTGYRPRGKRYERGEILPPLIPLNEDPINDLKKSADNKTK